MKLQITELNLCFAQFAGCPRKVYAFKKVQVLCFWLVYDR